MVNSDRIKNLRIALSQNQIEVANALNLSREAYCMYENGLRTPSYETLIMIAKYYHVSLDYLFGLSDNPLCYNDYSQNERFIIKHIHGIPEDMTNTFCSMIKLECLLKNKSIDP